jgi:2'-5' RNA ligase
MRLFSALWPPAEAVAALAAVTAPAGSPSGWQAVDPATWHLTLAFHGEADPGVFARRLDRAVGGVPGPRLRIAGAGAFPGVWWAGVEADVSGRLAAL